MAMGERKQEMERIALITGADRGLGRALAEGLLAKGWRVFAGQFIPEWPALGELKNQYPTMLSLVPLDVTNDASVRAAVALVAAQADHLDLLVNSAGVLAQSTKQGLREPQDYDDMLWMYEVNALGPLRVVEAFLPLMDQGALKRLCFVSSEAGSINRAERKAWYGYCMSKTALNRGVKVLYNRLRPEGYTFRVIHPGWMRTYMSGAKDTTADMEPEEAAVPALAYFLRERAGGPSEPKRIDEDRLMLRDWRGREWPW
jgi:NAD(P)-dependent dehydrogenase (short-subunit alcohol dehydrogenase family)